MVINKKAIQDYFSRFPSKESCFVFYKEEDMPDASKDEYRAHKAKNEKIWDEVFKKVDEDQKQEDEPIKNAIIEL